jgi:anti-sigma factor RsiW
MNPDKQDHLLLAAYIDGELSPGETLDLERRLQADPELRRLHQSLMALSSSVGAIFAETPIPAGHLDRISEQFAKVEALPHRRRLHPWPAIAAALLVGFCLGGPLGYGVSSLSASRQAHPIEDMVLASHLRGLAASQPYDVASSDRHTVKPWFNGRTAIAPDAPDLSAQGFPLAGGRVDIVDGKPVPTLVYRRRQHVISVTAVPGSDDGTAGSSRREGTQMERWKAGDLTYFATSDLNAKELGEFAALFRSATAPSS